MVIAPPRHPKLPTTPRVVVTSLIDGTEPSLEPAVLSDLESFRAAAGQEPGLRFEASAFSEGKFAYRAGNYERWRKAVALPAWSGRRDFLIQGPTSLRSQAARPVAGGRDPGPVYEPA